MAPLQARPERADAPARSSRRRQRSTRLTVAVALLVLAGVVVAGAIASASWLLVAIAAGLGVLLGAVATRITHSELVATRHDAARDRVAQARAYRSLTEERVAENAEFVVSMQEKVARYHAFVRDLEVALAAARESAAESTRMLHAEARRAEEAEREGSETVVRLQALLTDAGERATQALLRVAELEHELDVVRAELAAVTQAWHDSGSGNRRHA